MKGLDIYYDHAINDDPDTPNADGSGFSTVFVVNLQLKGPALDKVVADMIAAIDELSQLGMIEEVE